MMKNVLILATSVAAEITLTDSILDHLKATTADVTDACAKLVVADFTGSGTITWNDFCAGDYEDAAALGTALKAEYDSDNEGDVDYSSGDCSGSSAAEAFETLGTEIFDNEETLCADYVASSAFSASLTLGALATLALRLM